MGVVPGPLPQIAFFVRPAPRLAAVVAAEHAALVRLDNGPDAVVIAPRHGDADLPDHALGEPLVARDLLPGVAAVGGLEEPATRPAAREVPGTAPGLPERRVQDARVHRIHRQIDR